MSDAGDGLPPDDDGAAAREAVGSLGVEAAKLFGALSEWARDQGHDYAGSAAGASGLFNQALHDVNDHVATGSAAGPAAQTTAARPPAANQSKSPGGVSEDARSAAERWLTGYHKSDVRWLADKDRNGVVARTDPTQTARQHAGGVGLYLISGTRFLKHPAYGPFDQTEDSPIIQVPPPGFTRATMRTSTR